MVEHEFFSSSEPCFGPPSGAIDPEAEVVAASRYRFLLFNWAPYPFGLEATKLTYSPYRE